MDIWVRSGSLSLPLRAEGQPSLQPFPPLLARGAVSQRSPTPPSGWKWNLGFPVLLPQQLACQTLLAQPSSSSGRVLGRCQVPQICSPFQCLPRTQGAPLMLPRLFCAQGAGRAARLEWVEERRCSFPICRLCSLFTLPQPIPCPASPSPKLQGTCRFQLLHPRGHQWSLQAWLSRCPKRWMSLLQEVWSRLSCLASDSPRRE